MSDLKDKKLFDMEYSTQVRFEMEYLKSCGIKYTFVKRLNGIPTYKYEKSEQLFDALRLYYKLKNGGNI